MREIQARSFWHPLTQLQTGPATGRSFKTGLGLTVIERPNSDGGFVIEHLHAHKIIEAIQVTHNLARDAANGFSKKAGGRPQIPALQNWIYGAQRFWRAHSTRAFMPVMLKTFPASPALAFCYIAFKQLNGTIKPTQLATVMRAANKMFPDPAKQFKQKP
jgi:hypothetical protein